MRSLSFLDDPATGAFLLRLSLGVMFLAHGLQKIFIFTPAGTVGYFESIGLPGFLAYLTIAMELGGAALLIVGFQVRLLALAFIPLAIGAAVFGHGGNGWNWSNAGGGWEYPAFLVFAVAAQAFLGAGRFALDNRTPEALPSPA